MYYFFKRNKQTIFFFVYNLKTWNGSCLPLFFVFAFANEKKIYIQRPSDVGIDVAKSFGKWLTYVSTNLDSFRLRWFQYNRYSGLSCWRLGIDFSSKFTISFLNKSTGWIVSTSGRFKTCQNISWYTNHVYMTSCVLNSQTRPVLRRVKRAHQDHRVYN